MSITKDIEKMHHGQQSLARIVKNIVPLIVKHFQPFDGERAAIQSGRSAKFDKVVRAFYQEARPLLGDNQGNNVYIDDGPYSVWVKISINEYNEPCHGGGHTVNYFQDGVYIGGYEGQNFKYDFNPDEVIAYRDEILRVDLAGLYQVRDAMKELEERKKALEKTIPYAMRDLTFKYLHL